MNKLCIVIFLWLTVEPVAAEDLKPAFYLNQDQAGILKQQIKQKKYSHLVNALKEDFNLMRSALPQPVSKIHYEGFLDTDPKRLETIKALRDMNHLVTFLNHYYVYQDEFSLRKMKDFILAWAQTYKPTGNPINENKLEPVWISYAVIAPHFTPEQRLKIVNWMQEVVTGLQANTNVPMNNWQGKKIKITGTIGLILKNDKWAEEAVTLTRQYINASLYPDGTSIDLKQRDALSYHIGGLVPLLNFAINLRQFTSTGKTALYSAESEKGASLKKSVEYVRPFATGRKKRREWLNTTVALDKKRADAGIGKYQPGIYFKPENARYLFEIAACFDKSADIVVNKLNKQASFTELIIHVIRA